MAYIFVDRDNDMGGMRENMRRTMMRSGGNVIMRGTGMGNQVPIVWATVTDGKMEKMK